MMPSYNQSSSTTQMAVISPADSTLQHHDSPHVVMLHFMSSVIGKSCKLKRCCPRTCTISAQNDNRANTRCATRASLVQEMHQQQASWTSLPASALETCTAFRVRSRNCGSTLCLRKCSIFSSSCKVNRLSQFHSRA